MKKIKQIFILLLAVILCVSNSQFLRAEDENVPDTSDNVTEIQEENEDISLSNEIVLESEDENNSEDDVLLENDMSEEIISEDEGEISDEERNISDESEVISDEKEEISEELPKEEIEISESEEKEDVSEEDVSEESVIPELNYEVAKDFVDNEALVTGIIVNNITDGSGNFDADDEPGNDSSNNNRIVRTFDTIRYSVEYTINLRPESSYSGFENAWVNVELSIPGKKGDAEFIVGDMPWLEDAKTTYDNDLITVRGKTQVRLNNGIVPVPGTHGFTVVLKALGMKHGELVQPTFKIWMPGNPEEDVHSITCDDATETIDGQKTTIRVSADSRLDVIASNGNYPAFRYVNDTTGKVYWREEMEGLRFGYLSKWEFAIMLHSSSAQKGVMGVELPDGPIEFDFTSALRIRPEGDPTVLTDYESELWEWQDSSKGTSYVGTGYLGRQTNYYGASHYPTRIPHIGEDRNGMSQPGKFTVTQTGQDTYHVVVYDYEITTHFPEGHNWSGTSGVAYQPNESVFSGGMITTFTEVPYEFDKTTTYYNDIKITDVKYKNKSGIEHTDETRTNNNAVTMSKIRYKTGNFAKYIRTYLKNGSGNVGNIHPNYQNGDVVENAGDTIWLQSLMSFGDTNPDTYYAYAVDNLLKFDATAFRPIPGTETRSLGTSFGSKTFQQFRVIYAAKPDGTNWTDNNEQMYAKREDLVYYETLDALEADGKTCVAVMFESRNGLVTFNTDYPNYLKFQILKDMPLNKVYICTNDIYYWRKDLGENMTLDNTMLNPDTYIVPDCKDELAAYTPSKYDENGNFIANHADQRRGASVYIIGETNTVTKGFDQRTTTSSGQSNEKHNYNLNFGERTVDYWIQPTVTSISNDPNPTTLFITDILPKGISYKEGSSYIGGTFNTETNTLEGGVAITPEVVHNSDGTTTLTYTLIDVVPNKKLDKIHYSTTIGNVSDPINDVDEEENPFTTITLQGSLYGARTKETKLSLNVIKSASTSLFKVVDPAVIEKDGNIKYTISFSNSSQHNTRPYDIFDILPYDGDSRGSEFTGNFILNSVDIDLTHGSLTNNQGIKMYYTEDTAIRSMSNNAKILRDETINWIEVSPTTSTNKLSYAINKNATAIRIFGNSLIAFEALSIDVNMKTDGNEAEEVYINNASVYADRFADTVFSSNVVTHVVNRKLDGHVFFDDNRDSMMNDTYLKDITVELMKIDGTPATDVRGNLIEPVKTDVNGYYHFEDFAPGDYIVRVAKSQINPLWDEVERFDYTTHSAEFVDIDNDSYLSGDYDIIDSYFANINNRPVEQRINFIEAERLNSFHDSILNLNFGYFRPLGTLMITKTVSGNSGDPTKDFNFKVTLSGEDVIEDEYFYYISGGEGDFGTLTPENNVIRFSLKHGETISILLPYGTRVNVEEIDYRPYESTNSGANGTVPKGSFEITFNNELNLYGVRVRYLCITDSELLETITDLPEEPVDTLVDYDPTDRISYYESIGYELADNPFEESQYYEDHLKTIDILLRHTYHTVTEDNYVPDECLNDACTVKVPTDLEGQLSEDVNRTIRYWYGDTDEKKYDDNFRTTHFSRTITYDRVTGEEAVRTDFYPKQYTFTEVESPQDKYYFMDIETVPSHTVNAESEDTFVDVRYYQIQTNKLDWNEENLLGAKFTCIDSSTDKAIDSWESDGSMHIIENLHWGKTYIIREIETPETYVTAEDRILKIGQ